MDYFSLEGKNILVTGASSGIGRATAILCAQQGARVILLGRKFEGLEKTLTLMSGNGHLLIQFDLLQLDDIVSVLQKIVAECGLLHGLAHCAGIHSAKPLRMLTTENIHEIVQANVVTAILLAKAFRNKLVSDRPSSIVMLASVVATVGQPGVVAYALSKGALVAATKSLAAELAPEQIRINSVLPGVIKTPMTENLFAKMGDAQITAIQNAHLLGLGEPEDVACSIVFLLSQAARWITGSCLVVDGGYTAI